MGVLSSLMIAFQKDGSQALRRTSLYWLEAGRGLTCQRGRERVYNGKVSKVDAGSEGRPGLTARENEV